MKRVPSVLWLTLSVGAIFTALLVVAVVTYFWGDGDEGRLAICCFAAVFAVPLFVGSILILCRRRGLPLLKFGSVIFVCEPGTLMKIWLLAEDPAYLAYMAGRHEL